MDLYISVVLLQRSCLNEQSNHVNRFWPVGDWLWPSSAVTTSAMTTLQPHLLLLLLLLLLTIMILLLLLLLIIIILLLLLITIIYIFILLVIVIVIVLILIMIIMMIMIIIMIIAPPLSLPRCSSAPARPRAPLCFVLVVVAPGDNSYT